MNGHHVRALQLLGLTGALVLVFGALMGLAEHVSTWHGIYCTTGFATTAGCDLPMRTWQDYLLGEASMLLMVPLLTAVFSFFTTGLTASHVDKRHEELMDR